MKKKVLESYANLIASYGLNIQKGQDVIIRAATENSDFALLCVELCYKRGARKVSVEWLSQELSRLNYNYRTIETLVDIPKWEIEKAKESAEKLPALLWLDSDDPDGLKGIDPAKLGAYLEAKGKKTKKYRDQMDGRYQWCIAAIPSVKWAKKLFPELSKKKAIEALWEKILFSSRVTDNPIKSWIEHDEDLKRRSNALNSFNLKALHYTSKEGSDLTVGLIDDALFLGGGEETKDSKVYFQPNIPSEECFTTPKKGEAEGIVYATMPLSYQGALIENFSIRFHEGKAVEWHAEKNEEVLRRLLSVDEGASYIGECALVPNSSPIRESGILYYNTLFDENATCHIAFGAGFDSVIKGFESLSKEEIHNKGVNNSIIHIDFMVGSSSLNIDGITKEGKTIPIIKDGEWAF